MLIKSLDIDKSVYIIAEIGNNHEGNFDTAKLLLQKAAECGVNAVKFQTFLTDYYVSNADEARFKRLKSFELTFDQFTKLSELARDLDVDFISTPFDLKSAHFLIGICDALKVSSGDINFFPLIEVVVGSGRPFFISTGASDLSMVVSTFEYVRKIMASGANHSNFAFFHCVSSYPVPVDEANLLSIPFLKSELKCTVGYSDHTLGTDASVMAVALGARVIERHFTLDKNYSSFRDHQLSSDPVEMKNLVQRIRDAEKMLGSSNKLVQKCETAVVPLMRRSIVADRELKPGDILNVHDIKWVRPAGGLNPGSESEILGKRLTRPCARGEIIQQLHFE
jgi:sialic acid synthase SpsE